MLHEDYARPAPQEPWGYDNKLYEWQNSYEKLKVQKSKIKEELIRVAWHPSRWWDWCVLEDEKKDTEIFFFFDHLICVLSIRLSKNFSRNI